MQAAGAADRITGLQERGTELLRAISLLLALVLATIGAGTLAPSPALEASSHSAVRSFSQQWAPPGGRLVVTITATNYGGFGQVEETLPEGFSYTGSSLSEGSVTVDGQTVSFVLLGDVSFTYTVDIPDEEDSYTFSGVLKDANREEAVIGGASQVLVGPEPPATPTSEPAATPTPTLEPTATAVSEPTGAPTSAPESTEAPTVEPTASPAKTPVPTPTTAQSAPSPVSEEDTPEEAGGPGLLPIIMGGALFLSTGFISGYLVGRRKTA